jgi:lipopolysaccharide export system protein LptC
MSKTVLTAVSPVVERPVGRPSATASAGAIPLGAAPIGSHSMRRFELPTRRRRSPSAASLARRALFIRATKVVLPVIALGLLGTLAAWPELTALRDRGIALAKFAAGIDGAELIDAKYHAVDDKGRPYTVTADRARQTDADRVDLTTPKGDMLRQDGTWLMLQSAKGVLMQKSHQLDLSHDVVLYRDDGTTMRTASATVDLHEGAALGSDPVHVEGPFGTLDAAGFTLTDRGAVIQFPGPARLVLNGSSP